MTFTQSANATWIVFYQSPGGEQVMTERTTDLPGTVARLETAGYVVIDEIME